MRLKVFLVAALLTLPIDPVAAHSMLINSNPSAGAVLKKLPSAAWIKFNENLLKINNKSINRINVRGPKGLYSTGLVEVDGGKVSIKLKASKDKGNFTMNWRIVSEDGHPVSGSIKFKVI